MNKRSLPGYLVILFMAVLGSGCQPAIPTDEVVGNYSISGCYQVDFLGVTESSEEASTWRYHVQALSCAQNLRSWMLELPACASVVDASPTPWGIVSQDLNYQMSGVMWQTGADFQDAEFSVTLKGNLVEGQTRAGVEEQRVSVGSMDGPACKDQAPQGDPTVKAMAKVKVQSANCRETPVGKSRKIGLLYRDQEAEIVGRNDDPNNPWWYIKIPGQDGNCWLWGKTSTTTGNVEGLPIIK